MVSQANKPKARRLIELFLESAKLGTMRSVYERIEPDDENVIRTVLSPAATETGRFGSSASFLDPSTNLQNLPSKTANADPLFEVRGVITPRSGKLFWEADLSSAERRLLAYLAGERRAIELTEEGDAMGESSYIYKWFGAKLFDMDWEEINKKENYPLYHISKMSVLALDRGVGWKTLKDSINVDADITGASITAAKSKEAVSLFHRLFPGYRRFFDVVGETLRNRGHLVNCMGRKRIFFGRRSNWDSIVREGVSFLAQAVGDILNARLRRVWDEMDPQDVELLLQVHDSIGGETDLEGWRPRMRRIKSVLEEPIDLTQNVPAPSVAEIVIPAEIAVSTRSWGDVKEVAL